MTLINCNAETYNIILCETPPICYIKHKQIFCNIQNKDLDYL